MSFEPRDYLQHMLVEVEYLAAHGHDLSDAQSLADKTLQRAFVRSLEIIGEAARKTPPDFRVANPEIEWKAMAGMRDRLIHDYFGVDYELVWDVIRNRVPALHVELVRMLR